MSFRNLDRPAPVHCLTDNWTLELACRCVAGELHPEMTDASRRHRAAVVEEVSTALLQTLDLIVVADTIVFDGAWAQVWLQLPIGVTLRDSGVLEPLDLPEQFRQRVAASPIPGISARAGHIIESGAQYYVNLGRALGLDYWPVPQRSAYLAKCGYAVGRQSAPVLFGRMIDEQMRKLVADAFKGLGVTAPSRLFGLGSTVLASCVVRDDVFPAALELRNSKGCHGFRKWLAEVDSALETGDTPTIAKSLSDVRDALSDLERTFEGSKAGAQPSAKLQLGLSPSLHIEGDLIKRFFRSFRPKPYHLSFLRSQLRTIARNANVQSHVVRLFPELGADSWIP